MNEDYFNQIYACLLEEYPEDEVNDMLAKAEIDEYKDHVKVKYDNDVVDIFMKTRPVVLVHKLDKA